MIKKNDVKKYSINLTEKEMYSLGIFRAIFERMILNTFGPR